MEYWDMYTFIKKKLNKCGDTIAIVYSAIMNDRTYVDRS